MPAIDLARIIQKTKPPNPNRKLMVRWNIPTQQLLIDAVYEWYRNPLHDPTTPMLDVFRRCMHRILVQEEHREIVSYTQIEFLKPGLQAKLKAELDAQHNQAQQIAATQEVPPERKLEIIKHYLDHASIEDLEAHLTKRKAQRDRELIDLHTKELAEIKALVQAQGAEIARYTQKTRQFVCHAHKNGKA